MGTGIVAELTQKIRDIPDFPQKGIVFKDITPLLNDPRTFKMAIDAMAHPFVGRQIELVVGIEARGFIFAPALAYHLGAGFVPVRKPKKLPSATEKISYELEYGHNTIAIHVDAFKPGSRVLLVDDLLATGGTAQAAARLVEQAGGRIIGIHFLIELGFLKGRNKLTRYPVYSLVIY